MTLERSRITGGHRPAQDQYAYDHTYFFDKSGNRTRKVALAFDAGGAQTGATTTQYVYFAGGKDRLAQELEYAAEMPYSATGGTPVAAYDYNANGFLIAKSVDIDSPGERKDYTFTPNAEDRLARASMAEGGSPAAAAAHFVYDVNGIRVQHWTEALAPTPAAATLARTYLVDSQNHTGYAQVLQERTPGAEGALQVARSYVIGDDVLSQMAGTGSAGDLQHLLYDGHGSTRLLYDTNATTPGLTQVYDYDAYGNAIGFDAADPATTATSLLYCGEQFDQTQQVGMLYLRARWYDARVGRFNKADPFGGSMLLPASYHRYSYAHADPLNGLDPSGLIEMSLGGLLFRMAIGALLLATVLPAYRGAYLAGMQASSAGTGESIFTAAFLGRATLQDWKRIVSGYFGGGSAGAVNVFDTLTFRQIDPLHEYRDSLWRAEGLEDSWVGTASNSLAWVGTASLYSAAFVWTWSAAGGGTMDIAISRGTSPYFFHVRYGAAGLWEEAVGWRLGQMTIIRASGPLGLQISGIPVVNSAAVVAGEGGACSCLWAAVRAFARGWGL